MALRPIKPGESGYIDNAKNRKSYEQSLKDFRDPSKAASWSRGITQDQVREKIAEHAMNQKYGKGAEDPRTNHLYKQD
jgi:hypothetical protein